MIKNLSTSLVVGVAALLGTAHAASVVAVTDQQVINDNFTSFSGPGAGVQGVELRGGDGGGRATWEVGFGEQTSQPGKFVQAQREWIETPAGQGFVFSIDSAGEGTLQILDGGSATITRVWDQSPLGLGNAIEFFAKREAELTITSVNGMPFNFNVGDITTGGSEAFMLVSDDFLNGFTIEGTVGIVNGRNSAYGVIMKAGRVPDNFGDPVPVPAAGLLFAGAFGAHALRRRRKAQN